MKIRGAIRAARRRLLTKAVDCPPLGSYEVVVVVVVVAVVVVIGVVVGVVVTASYY